MSRLSKIYFNPDALDTIIEMDENEKQEDDDFEEEDVEDDEEEDDNDENDENLFENDLMDGDEDEIDFSGTVEVDQERNELRFVRDEPREFCEQASMVPPFVKIGHLTLPALREEDMQTCEPVNPCSLCLQRNCNVVILPCNDTEFCLCCVYENFTVRNELISPLVCPTCCGPISNVIRLKTKE